MPEKKFVFDANAVLTLGRNSIKDHTTAVLELVKNAYDADADCVEVQVFYKNRAPYIRIADNGQGMSEADLVSNWLRIGFSEKVSNKTTSNFNRRKTGEKGNSQSFDAFAFGLRRARED
ncbi:ATP-binding protein [Roseateles chitinivorans]|uniref:ATP-binding protein n=1 Tax=Roseateles chitinivorans TaxID=2917965 RepID=UPI003D668DE0